MYASGSKSADLSSFSLAIAYLSGGNQSVSSASWETVEFDAIAVDIHSEFDIVTNHRFVANSAGRYHVHTSITWDAWTADEYAIAAIRHNGAYKTAMKQYSPIADGWTLETAIDLVLAAGDNIDVQAYNHCGVAREIVIGQQKTFVSIHRIA